MLLSFLAVVSVPSLAQQVQLFGTLVTASPTPVVSVATIAESQHVFELRGDNRIGRTLRLRVESPTAMSYYLLVALGTGFLPLDGLFPGVASGTFLLDIGTNVLLHAGPTQQSWEEPWQIPNNTAFIGLSLHFQAAMLGPQLPFVYLNAATTVLAAG